MNAGAIVATSAGPAELARVLHVSGPLLTLEPISGGPSFQALAADVWPLLDGMP